MTMEIMNKLSLAFCLVFLLSSGVSAKPLNIAAHQTEIYIPDRIESHNASNASRIAASNTSNSSNSGNTGTHFDDLFNEGGASSRPRKKNPQCEDIVAQINEDITKSRDRNSDNQPNYHWKKISWLEALLRDPDSVKVVEETLYVWNNYSILLRNGNIIDIKGNYPGKNPIRKNLTGFDYVQQTIAEIGDPKNMLIGELSQFTWVCKDKQNSVTATIDEKGTVIGISGTYCSNASTCTPFEANGDQSVLNKKQSES